MGGKTTHGRDGSGATLISPENTTAHTQCTAVDRRRPEVQRRGTDVITALMSTN
jgi:hypothetical protein